MCLLPKDMGIVLSQLHENAIKIITKMLAPIPRFLAQCLSAGSQTRFFG
jgi:hypothetical protein